MTPEYEELATQAVQAEHAGDFLEAVIFWKKANMHAGEIDKEWTENRAAFCMKAAPRNGVKAA
jgi:hypothetical protein